MNISKTKRNFIGFLFLYTVISTGLATFILHEVMPGHYFGGFPLIPAYFFLIGLFSIYMFDACRRHAPQKLLLVYLGMKVLKMLLSLMLLMVYCVVVREEARVFLLTFIAFYLMYLIYETWFFFKFEVGLKRKKKNKNIKNDETVA